MRMQSLASVVYLLKQPFYPKAKAKEVTYVSI